MVLVDLGSPEAMSVRVRWEEQSLPQPGCTNCGTMAGKMLRVEAGSAMLRLCAVCGRKMRKQLNSVLR